MKKALLKDTIKEIVNNFKRFISLLLIVLLGVGFFCGIKATSPDMKNIIDVYFDEKQVMDIQVLSTLGLTNSDIEELKKIEGIENIEESYSTDAIIISNEEELVVKLMAMPKLINQVNIIEGRLPSNNKECIIEPSFLLETKHQIGDKITIKVEDTQDEDGNNKPLLKENEVTIVGTANSPLYISRDRGTTKLESGKISYYMYVPLENFDTDISTVAYITVKDANNLKTYNTKYEETVEEVEDKINNITEEREQARYKEIYEKANKKVQDSQKELDKQKQKTENEIKNAKNEIENAKEQLEKGRIELENKMASTNKQLAEAKEKLKKSDTELTKNEEAFIKEKKMAEAEIQKAQEQLKALQQLEQMNPGTQTELIETIKLKIETAQNQLLQNEQQLAKARETLNEQKINLENKEKSANQEFVKAQNELNIAQEEIKTNEAKLNTEKKKADKEIQKAQEKIDEAKTKLKDIKKPEWYVLNRNQNVGYVSYLQETDRINNIAKVFPVVFFVVAALISLTSMTRMVEEQRVQIGTLKALGYNKRQIACKYIIYASLATIVGGLIGMTIGFNLIPKIICGMYGMMYTLPEAVLEFNMEYAIYGMIVAILCTVGATIYTCVKELNNTPANLMRPKAPKPGKRVLIEKISFIWKRLNFTQKVTARNIFRYKKRFLMTIIGVAACTSLIIAGFGLRDAVGNMIPSQYGEIFTYNVEITLKDTLKEKEIDNEYEKIANKEQIKNSIKANMQSVNIIKNENNQSIQLIVPEDKEKLHDFIKLRDRTKKEDEYVLNNESIIITEKIAKLLDIKENEIITIENADKEQVQVKVDKITENYLRHYIYMTQELYEKLYQKEIKPNTILSITDNLTQEQENDLGKEILKDKDAISGVSFTSTTTDIFSEVMDNMGMVVWILIIAAGLLALVVLYNLSNTNISERIRELATIKVLGFYDREVYEYIGKEMIILTIIGMILGLVGGLLLTNFIIKTCELDVLMFDPKIKVSSYLYGIGITAIFAAIVNIATYFSLKKINMIESLKSVE